MKDRSYILKKAIDLSDRNARILYKFLTGGAALGASAGLTTSLFNAFKDLGAENGRTKRLDDDTIFFNPSRKKKEKKDDDESESVTKLASLGAGLGIAGGLTAALGTYTMVRKFYENAKKKQLQKRLDAIQERYYDSLNSAATAPKKASGKPLGLGEALVSGGLVSLPILAALGSGALSHYALDELFPKVQPKRRRLGPKRIVIRDDSVEEEEGEDKVASYEVDVTDAWEMAVDLLLADPKRAARSDLPDMISTFAQGRGKEASDAFELDTRLGFDVLKGARANLVEPEAIFIGTRQMLKDASVGPIAKALIAAEIIDAYPLASNIASHMDETTKCATIIYLAEMGKAYRNDMLSHVVETLEEKLAGNYDVEVKSASEINELLSGLSSAKSEGSADDDLDTRVEDDTTQLEIRGSKVLAQGPFARKFYSENKDLIDELFSEPEDQVDENQNEEESELESQVAQV
jgi:hypothetical protein